MKKVVLGLILFIGIICKVEALSINEIELGDIYKSGTEVTYDDYYSSLSVANVVYYDKDNNLLEAYGLKSFYNTYDSTGDNSVYYIGDTCAEVGACSSTETLIYTSGKTLDDIKYWEVIGVNDPDLLEFCEIKDNGYSSASSYEAKYDVPLCNNLYSNSGGGTIYTNHYSLDFPFIIFKELEVKESPYTLECTNESLIKGSTADCILKVNALEELKEIVVTFDTSKYDFDKAEGTEDWELTNSVIENGKAIYTLTNDDGFKGEGKVLKFTIKFKEDLLPGFIVETENILYTLTNNVQLESTAKDTLDEAIKEAVDPVPEEKNDNPDTGDSILVLIVLSVILIFITVICKTRKEKFN